jgi:hypothetical protein
MTIKNNLKFFLRNFGLEINKYNLFKIFDFRLNHFLKIEKLDFTIWDLQRGFSDYKNGKIYQIDGVFFKN